MVYLQHHGILGQKWGQRNGPPYPLGASDHSSRERKAGWRKSLGKSGSDDNAKKRRGLSDNQKRALKVGAAVGATALIAIGGAYLYKTGALDDLVKTGKASVDLIIGSGGSDASTIDSKTGLPIRTKELTLDQIDNPNTVNPDHRRDNCKEATLVWAELQLHDPPLDIAAGAREMEVGKSNEFVEKHFTGDSGSHVLSISPVVGNGPETEARVKRQLLKKSKDGDVGSINVEINPLKLGRTNALPKDKNGEPITGHTFGWRNRNGTIEFIDTQGDRNGNVRPDLPRDYLRNTDPQKEIECYNYSNMLLKEDALKEACKR